MRFIQLLVTAYCLVGTTFSGVHTHPGVVAVDPRVIPIGTTLAIPGYGRGRALDTGSAIRGRRADVWFSSCSRARSWGVRRLRVRVS